MHKAASMDAETVRSLYRSREEHVHLGSPAFLEALPSSKHLLMPHLGEADGVDDVMQGVQKLTV